MQFLHPVGPVPNVRSAQKTWTPSGETVSAAISAWLPSRRLLPDRHSAWPLAAIFAAGRLGRTSRFAKAKGLNETELVFREAFEAEAQRCELLAQQLQEVFARKQVEGGKAIETNSVEAPVAGFSPDLPGGKASWQDAFEAAKDFAESLEKQLEEVRSAARETLVDAKVESTASGADVVSEDQPQVEESEAVKKLEVVAEKIIEDEKTLRFIAAPILVRENNKETMLPPVKQVQELVSPDLFFISSETTFERVFIFEGQVAEDVAPADALSAMQQRLVSSGLDSVELFLQRCIEPSKSALLVMLKEDMPNNEFAWWQWLLCGLAFLATLISINIDAFSVSTVALEQINALDLDELMKLANLTLPTAASILSTVVAMEVARRAAAAKYGVDLTPPVFVPVWPFVSVGCFGAITRQQSIVPNEDANLSMSVSAGLAGYAVSFFLLLLGLALGSDQEQQISLNYQILPLVLKILMRPLLGEPSATEQPDPFSDPVNVAFPANPILIGGTLGVVITSLNMLALGRLDGAVLARTLRGSGTFAGLISCSLLISGSLDNSTSLLYATFAFYAIVLQGGYNCPARDSLTEPDPNLRNLAILLLVLGILLSIPGSLIPGF